MSTEYAYSPLHVRGLGRTPTGFGGHRRHRRGSTLNLAAVSSAAVRLLLCATTALFALLLLSRL
jgi:hypothetical protein